MTSHASYSGKREQGSTRDRLHISTMFSSIRRTKPTAETSPAVTPKPTPTPSVSTVDSAARSTSKASVSGTPDYLKFSLPEPISFDGLSFDDLSRRFSPPRTAAPPLGTGSTLGQAPLIKPLFPISPLISLGALTSTATSASNKTVPPPSTLPFTVPELKKITPEVVLSSVPSATAEERETVKLNFKPFVSKKRMGARPRLPSFNLGEFDSSRLPSEKTFAATPPVSSTEVTGSLSSDIINPESLASVTTQLESLTAQESKFGMLTAETPKSDSLSAETPKRDSTASKSEFESVIDGSRLEESESGGALQRPVMPVPTNSKPMIDKKDFALADPDNVSTSSLPGQGPVINQNGTFNLSNLQSFVSTLRKNIPELRGFFPASQHKERALLVERLDAIEDMAMRYSTLTSDQQMKVRDHFAAAAKLAQSLGHQSLFSKAGETVAGKFTDTSASKKERAKTALVFSCLGACLEELKRLHLTAAAPAVMDDFTDLERLNMVDKVPMLELIATSAVVKNETAGLTYYGPAMAGISGQKALTYRRDEDLGMNGYNTKGMSLKGGAPSAWLAQFSILAGIDLGGVYFESEKLSEVLKLMVNHDANHAWTNSANPKIRDLRNQVKGGYNRIAENFLGMHYTEAAGKPYYLKDKKLNKGVDSSKLHMMADALDFALQFNPSAKDTPQDSTEDVDKTVDVGSSASSLEKAEKNKFTKLFKESYPTAKARLEGDSALEYEDALNKIHPLSRPIGDTLPSRNYYGEANASVGRTFSLGAGPGITATAQALASARWLTAEFRLKNTESSHRLLDPLYHADMKLTFKLINKLDSLLKPGVTKKTDDPAPAKLYLYDEVQREFGGDEWKDLTHKNGEEWAKAQTLSEKNADYYGELEDIPEQYRASLLYDSFDQITAKVKRAREYSNKLKGHYLAFVGDAATVAVRPDKKTPAITLEKMHKDRVAAFNRINVSIWGEGKFPTGGYPGGVEAALKDPEKFMARTHDAIGLGLAGVGVHISVLKRGMHAMLEGIPETDETALHKKNMQKDIRMMDGAYLHAKTLMDKVHLPMKIETVFLSEGTFKDTSLSRRHNLILKAGGNLGLRENIFSAISSKFGRSPDNYQIDNQALGIFVTAQCTYVRVPYQKPSRQGEFLEFDFQIGSGMPIVLDKLVSIVMKAIKKASAKDPTPEEERRQKTHLSQQLQGLVWDGSKAHSGVLRLRKAPYLDGAPWQLQIIRKYETKTAGPKGAVPIPSPWGIFKANAAKQTTLKNTYYEVIGPELGYIMLQHKRLKSVLTNAHDNTLDGQRNENDVLKRILNNDIDTDEELRDTFKGEKDGSIIKTAYFSHRETIVRMLDDYEHYKDEVQKADVLGIKSSTLPKTNEFFRYFESDTDEEPFRRVAEVAREVRHFAPGSTADLNDKDIKDLVDSNPFDVADNTSDKTWQSMSSKADPFVQKPGLTSKVEMPEGINWKKEREKILKLDTREERVAYFCTDRGRKVLDMFVEVIDRTKEVHDLSRHRVDLTKFGYWTALKNKDEAAKAAAAESISVPTASEKMVNRLKSIGILNTDSKPPSPPVSRTNSSIKPAPKKVTFKPLDLDFPPIGDMKTFLDEPVVGTSGGLKTPLTAISQTAPRMPEMVQTAPVIPVTPRPVSTVVPEDFGLSRKTYDSMFGLHSLRSRNTQAMYKAFLTNLLRVPLVKDEPVPVSSKPIEDTDFRNIRVNQYAAFSTRDSSGKTFSRPARRITSSVSPEQFGEMIGNKGGGDCLLYALEGRNLGQSAVVDLRGQIADIKRNEPDTELSNNANAHQIATGLEESGFGSDAAKIMTDRHRVPNSVYAEYQSIPGTYLGFDELKQWSRVQGNQNKIVTVIDAGSGTIERIENGVQTSITADQVDRSSRSESILLYKNSAHWARIDKSKKPALA